MTRESDARSSYGESEEARGSDVEVLRRAPREGADGGSPERPSSLGDLVGLLKGLPGFARLLYRLMKDPRVSRMDRALFGFMLGYLFSPVDFIPDWIPVLGALDDVVLLVVALDRLLHRTDPLVLEEHWDGDPARLWQLQGTLDWATDVLPGWARRVLRGL